MPQRSRSRIPPPTAAPTTPAVPPTCIRNCLREKGWSAGLTPPRRSRLRCCVLVSFSLMATSGKVDCRDDEKGEGDPQANAILTVFPFRVLGVLAVRFVFAFDHRDA